MKIKRGDCVMFIGSSREQVNWGANDNPDDVLVRGKEYIVEQTEYHTSHTKLLLAGYEGKYNSVSFIRCG